MMVAISVPPAGLAGPLSCGGGGGGVCPLAAALGRVWTYLEDWKNTVWSVVRILVT